MRKGIITTTAAVAVIIAGSLASIEAQARSIVHHKSTHRHVTQQTSDITSFSSSSADLHVGVNHPPKK